MESDCDPTSPECECWCLCGCQNDPNGHDLPFKDADNNDLPTGFVGLCYSCWEGNHERPSEHR
jgi:hypothetical protein